MPCCSCSLCLEGKGSSQHSYDWTLEILQVDQNPKYWSWLPGGYRRDVRMVLIGSSSPDSSCSSSGALKASQPLYSVFLLFVVRSCLFSAQLSGRSSCSLSMCVLDFAHRKGQSPPSPSCCHLGPPQRYLDFHQLANTSPRRKYRCEKSVGGGARWSLLANTASITDGSMTAPHTYWC